MAELFPSDQKLEQFSTRYAYQTLDPCKYLPIISPAHQLRPKALLPLPPEAAAAAAAGHHVPPPPILPPAAAAHSHGGGGGSGGSAGGGSGGGSGGGYHPPPPSVPPPNLRIGSPKRVAHEDVDDFSSRARKLPRAESPVPVLKGAAGRRLNQIKQQQAAAAAAAAAATQGGSGQGPKDSGRRGYTDAPARRDRDGNNSSNARAASNDSGLPEAIHNLFCILPGAERYNAVRFKPEAMVTLVASVQVPRPEDISRGGAPTAGYYGN